MDINTGAAKRQAAVINASIAAVMGATFFLAQPALAQTAQGQQTAQAPIGSAMDVSQARGATIEPGQGTSINPNGQATPENPLGAGGITVTTTPQIDGYHVRRYLGVVRGVRVFQPTIGESFKASFKGIIGGNIGSYVEMCEKARQQAYDQMLERATALGANAVLGFRFDSSAFSINSSEMGTEVLCYGTAVYEEQNR